MTARLISPPCKYADAAFVSAGAESGFNCKARSKANSASDVCFAKKKSASYRGEKIGIVGELALDRSQHAITTDHEWRRMVLHPRVDIRDAEISFLQIGRRLAPRGDVSIFRERLLRFRTPLDSMVGESRVSSILGIPPRHVAADTVTVLARMRSRKLFHVARETFGPVN